MASTVVGQEFLFQSGSGSDAWTFAVVIDDAGDYFIEIRQSPMGNDSYDSLSIPEVVIDDMANAIELVRSGGVPPSGTTGTT